MSLGDKKIEFQPTELDNDSSPAVDMLRYEIEEGNP